MEQQIFSDGISTVTIVGGTVRLDLVTFSATEKDAKGQPLAVFCQRVVMGVDGFLRTAEKIQEAAQTLSRLAQRSAAAPQDAFPESPEPVPAPPVAAPPAQAAPAQASAQTQAAPAQRPFP